MTRKDRTIRHNTSRESAWLAMRELVKFDKDDILGKVNIEKGNLSKFVSLLIKTKYLLRINDSYFLVRNTGTKPPVHVLDKDKYIVYDENLGEYFEGNRPKRKEKYTQNTKKHKKILEKEIAKKGMKKVGEKIGYSISSLSLFLQDKYPASTENIIKAIEKELF